MNRYSVHYFTKGSFLIAYLLAVVLVGTPMFLLELCLGQRWAVGGLEVWRRMWGTDVNDSPTRRRRGSLFVAHGARGNTSQAIAAPWVGVGVAGAVMSFWVNVHFAVILAWAAYYLWASFAPVLPWTQCGAEWATNSCRSAFL